MRHRKDYSLYKRRSRRGSFWYYRTYDQDGNRTTGRSTGQTNRTLAERHCNALLRKGELVPAKEISFEAYAADWWDWERCPYVRGRLARSPADRPTISRAYADKMRRDLEAHVLPAFRRSRLSAITPRQIEAWMFGLRDDGLSPKRINNVASCLRIMLHEALRLGHLQRDPFAAVRPFADNSRVRGAFTIEEVRRLFDRAQTDVVWQGHLLYRTINELAAASGMRLGEILAVRDDDVHAEGWIHVAHSWTIGYGLGPTKTRQVRDVPLPARVLEDMTPFLGTGGFVFSFNHGESPATGSRVTQHLYGALERAGISQAERKRRGLCFHSWRYTFNTMMRARAVPTALLQRVTGHLTTAMVEHYTSFALEDFADIAAVQGEVFA